MKTKVRFKRSTLLNDDWKEGDCGYVDGYLIQGNDIPFAVVVKDEGRIVMAPLWILEVLT